MNRFLFYNDDDNDNNNNNISYSNNYLVNIGLQTR